MVNVLNRRARRHCSWIPLCWSWSSTLLVMVLHCAGHGPTLCWSWSYAGLVMVLHWASHSPALCWSRSYTVVSHSSTLCTVISHCPMGLLPYLCRSCVFLFPRTPPACSTGNQGATTSSLAIYIKYGLACARFEVTSYLGVV